MNSFWFGWKILYLISKNCYDVNCIFPKTLFDCKEKQERYFYQLRKFSVTDEKASVFILWIFNNAYRIVVHCEQHT